MRLGQYSLLIFFFKSALNLILELKIACRFYGLGKRNYKLYGLWFPLKLPISSYIYSLIKIHTHAQLISDVSMQHRLVFTQWLHQHTRDNMLKIVALTVLFCLTCKCISILIECLRSNYPGTALKCYVRDDRGRGKKIGLQECEWGFTFGCRLEGNCRVILLGL